MSTFDIGDLVPVYWALTSDGVAANGTVVLTVTAPDGTTSTPAVSNPSTGSYTASITPTQAGTYRLRWVSTGAVVAAEDIAFDVRRTGANVVLVADVRAALNMTSTAHDVEIQRAIDAALGRYERVVGPLPGQVTEYLDGGHARLILDSPHASSLVSVEYDDGTVIDVADLSVRDGMVRWGYGTAGWFTAGSQNVVITYLVGELPADHRFEIVQDVAGWYSHSQRGTSGPQFPSDGLEAPFALSPMTSFPRIDALAPLRIA